MLRFITIWFLHLQVFAGISQILPCPSHFQTSGQSTDVVHFRNEAEVIPVVFHLIQHEGSIELDDTEVSRLLEALNTAFLNGDEMEHKVPVWSTAGKVGFEFKLAELDPSGLATSGIVRRTTPLQDIGDLISTEGISYIKSNELGGSDPWDIDSYVNIWIGERSISLGSTISSNSDSEDIEGIIISYNALVDSPKTISHEMGHYFGLLHPWGNFTGCDGEDDGITDTPFQAFPDFTCQRILNCGNYTLAGNIMDFNDDDCLLYFSRLQASGIQQYASAFKGELLNSSDCFWTNLPLKTDWVTTNTFYGSLEVYIDSSRPLESARLISMDGKVISTSDAKGQSFLNIPIVGISPGVYVLVLVREKELLAKKIIIKG